MAKNANSATDLIYQLKITLRDSKPPIWRRVLVPAGFTLAKLHRVIQTAMGWTDSHLHQFKIDGQFYGVPSEEDWHEVLNERSYSLEKVAPCEKSKFLYEYDFGDSWEHVIVVEKILPFEAGKDYPLCIKGKRACPPEDVGGVWGYEEFLQAVNDPDNEEHESYLEWVEKDFHSEEFDMENINRQLRKWATKK
jgi:hypothetical protein